MVGMVLLLELPLDMPAASPRHLSAFRGHSCQKSSLVAFALLFCATPFLGTGLPLKSPCCTRHIAVWLRVGSSRVKPHSSNCAACGLPFFGGIQCLQICICIRAVRLSRFVELSQLSGGFLTESSLGLRHTVASRVVVEFHGFVLSLSFCCCQRCDVAEQLSRSVTQVRIKAALHCGVAWKLCRPLSSGRLFLR